MLMKRKILVMGTPFFAAQVLEHLLTLDEVEIIGVVCQPDRKMSRRKKIVYSEVKEVALRKDLPLFQPEKIKDLLPTIQDLKPDKIITCAYGQFLPQSILDFGVINIHASLLPKYRGGAPMQHAIMNNESKTGISLMKSVLKMDAGPVYKSKEVDIEINDTLTTLELKLIQASKQLLSQSILDVIDDKIEPVKQDESKVTFSLTIKREDEFIDFNRDQLEVYNHLRALIEEPCGYSFINGKRIKFTKVSLGDKVTDLPHSTIRFEHPEYFEVSTNNGMIKVLECQLEGKQRQKASDIYNGYHQAFNLRRLNYEN